MQCFSKIDVQNYLCSFNKILSTMAHKMLCTPPQKNVTIYFIECMIPHHEAAIYMCENLLKYTNYEPLIKIANNIIEMQTRGVEQMKSILRENNTLYTNSIEDSCNYQERYFAIVNLMVDRMNNAPRCNNINLNFVNEMIPHHEGAISMCNNLLKYNINPKLSNVAKSIIKEQSEGVIQLKTILYNLCK